MEPVKVHWHTNKETRYPFGKVSPDPAWFEPIGFPEPWPNRPWIYAVMVASKNGVVAWKRKPGEEHPVHAILGSDPRRPERIADLLHMRHLRCFGDCSVGAETQRDQRGLIQTPQEPWERKAYPELQPVSEALYRFRVAHNLPLHPRNVRYSPSGRLDRDEYSPLSDPLFSTPDVEVVVITAEEGALRLEAAGAGAKGVKLIVEPTLDAVGLIRAHERLFSEYGTRYLDCEGGETILTALREAGILDEVFVTTTDVVINEAEHEGVKHLFDAETEGAELIAEGTISPESSWTFRRWRFNKR